MRLSTVVLTNRLAVRSVASTLSLGTIIVNTRTRKMLLMPARQLPNLFQIERNLDRFVAVSLAHSDLILHHYRPLSTIIYSILS